GGSARTVNRVAAAFEIELIADPARDGIREPAGERFLTHGGKRRFVFRFKTVEKSESGVPSPQSRVHSPDSGLWTLDSGLHGLNLFRQRGFQHAANVGPAQPHEVRT